MQYRCEKWNHKTVIYTIRTFLAPAPPDTYYIVSHGIATNSPKSYKYSKNKTTKIKKREYSPHICREYSPLDRDMSDCAGLRLRFTTGPAADYSHTTLPRRTDIISSPSHPRRMPSSPAYHWPRQAPSGS